MGDSLSYLDNLLLEYMKDHIFELQTRYEDMVALRSYVHNLSSCENLNLKKTLRFERDSNP